MAAFPAPELEWKRGFCEVQFGAAFASRRVWANSRVSDSVVLDASRIAGRLNDACVSQARPPALAADRATSLDRRRGSGSGRSVGSPRSCPSGAERVTGVAGDGRTGCSSSSTALRRSIRSTKRTTIATCSQRTPRPRHRDRRARHAAAIHDRHQTSSMTGCERPAVHARQATMVS
jgi:hypothetical protein